MASNGQKAARTLVSDMIFLYSIPLVGRLAQLARASRLHREGRGFESLSAHQIEYEISPFGEIFVERFSYGVVKTVRLPTVQ
jgi:hypothetical protein